MARTDSGQMSYGNGLPISTPSGPGLEYLDLDTEIVYVSIGSNSPSDWVPINSFGSSSGNIDGGYPSDVYLPAMNLDGGSP